MSRREKRFLSKIERKRFVFLCCLLQNGNLIGRKLDLALVYRIAQKVKTATVKDVFTRITVDSRDDFIACLGGYASFTITPDDATARSALPNTYARANRDWHRRPA